jgi:hypothetical protein
VTQGLACIYRKRSALFATEIKDVALAPFSFISGITDSNIHLYEHLKRDTVSGFLKFKEEILMSVVSGRCGGENTSRRKVRGVRESCVLFTFKKE